MSEDDSPTIDENNLQENSIKFDEKFLIKSTNENNKFIIDRNAKQNCKILQISSELDIDQKLTIISALEPSEYPNLFIFIIEHQDGSFQTENQGNKAQQLEESLNKFGASRPLIIQQIFDAENETKFYYKCENSSEIVDIDQHYPEDYELYEKWQNILSCLLDQKLQPFEDKLHKKLSCIKDNSIVLRFLRTLHVQEAFFGSMALKVAANGSKADLLAVLDASYENNGRILNNQAQNYIKYVFEEDESGSESSDAPNDLNVDQMEVETDLEEAADEDQDDPMDGTSSQPKKKDSSQSVLLTAVQNSNQEIIDYLIAYWTPLIQQLPVEHQIRISTTAYDTNQLDVLCDLLDTSDLPFPDDFSIKENQVNHKRLRQIINERSQLEVAINKEDFEEIDEFINSNQSLKFVYNIDNSSVLTQAAILKKFSVFYYLKSLGFQGENCKDVLNLLDEEDKKQAIKQATEQRKTNIDKSLLDFHKSVWHLSARSLIHNRKISKQNEAEYRSKIRNWLKDIQKIAPEMLDVAASCEYLKIIFDFESHSVENASLENPGSAGTTYSIRKWIFIGAKFTDKASEQKVKGVLAHELCHYVMGLVYENQEFPYYEGDKRTEGIFKEILAIIDKWSITKEREPDDECDGIISTVYRLYESKDFEPELIVRVVHILAHYDDNSEKSNLLQGMYQILFDFWYNHVVPEMQNYFKKDKVAIRINATVELLSSLSKSKIEFIVPKDMEQLTESKVTIITSNVPKLLLINIHKYLQEKCGSLLKSQNVFLEPEKIMIEQVWKDLKDLYARDVKQNVIVDCTKENVDNLSSILTINSFNFILVASSQEQCTKLKRICRKKRIKPINEEVNYNWSDLNEESQIQLLQTDVVFQNNSELSLLELLSNKLYSDDQTLNNFKELSEISDLIDAEILNILVNNQNISINSKTDNDSTEKHFEFLYQTRNFIKKNGGHKMSLEKLLTEVNNKQFVLLSDIAGTGKSWTVRNISKIICDQNPTRWVTYMDLKQFIQEFKKKPVFSEFSVYFLETFLKPKTKFEANLFKYLYKNGRVSILFDAFDEIAPDCADFVANLAQSFEYNNGNQLWIVTRDYFEVNLQQRLNPESVFKLDEFTEKDGINFIVASWILLDLKDKKIFKCKKDFESYMKNFSNYKNYRQKAQQIVRKVAMTKHRSVGLPQLFSMIADGFKDAIFTSSDLKGSKIFSKFAKKLYKKWSDDKGQIRKDASIDSQENTMNFWMFHQYSAIESLFPELAKLIFPNYNKREWPDEEIVACGLMSKKGGFIYFLHETFREFFVADFIAKELNKLKVDENVLDIFIRILTVEKYGVIRMFLNDAIEHSSVLEKIKPEVQKCVENFYNLSIFCELFTENLEILANFVIGIFQNGNYENVKKILYDGVMNIVKNTKNLKVFSTFQNFLIDFLNVEDLKSIIIKFELCHNVLGSNLEADAFEDILKKVEIKLGQEVVQQELKVMKYEGNLISFLCSSQNLTAYKVQKCLELIQMYLKPSEVIRLMERCNRFGQNILQLLLEGKGKFKIFWTGAKNKIICMNFKDDFKRIIKQIDGSGETILHLASKENDIEIHESLWEMLLSTVDDREELKKFILQKDFYGDNFIHNLVIYNKSYVIDFTFQQLNNSFNQSQIQELYVFKGQHQENLLHAAANCSKEVKLHQILWNSACKFSNFLDIIKEVDVSGHNVLSIAALNGTSEILEFMHEKLKLFASDDQIKKLLTTLDKSRRNIIQFAATDNNSLDLHATLWKILKSYFNSSELLEFTKHLDVNYDNLLLSVIHKNTKEIIKLNWQETKEVISSKCVTEHHKNYLERCNNFMDCIYNSADKNIDDKDILRLHWIRCENSRLFGDDMQIFNRSSSVMTSKDLLSFAFDENIQNHNILWNNLKNNYKNRNDLKKLITERNIQGNNFIHLLIIYNNSNVIEFTLNQLKEHFNEQDCNEILRSKGRLARNLLQVAAVNSPEVKTHTILWKKLRDSCHSDNEFLEILTEVDDEGDNVFHLAAAFTSSEVYEFMEKELEKKLSRDEIRKLLIKLGLGNKNLLQAAATHNKSLDLHKRLWNSIKEYFNASEILILVKHVDKFGKNLLLNVIENFTKDVIKLTWRHVEEALNTDEYLDDEHDKNIERCGKVIEKVLVSAELNTEDKNILKLVWMTNRMSVKTFEELIPFTWDKNIKNHQVLWKHLTKNLINSKTLKKLFFEKNRNGDNFIHLLVIWNTEDVIEFTLNKFKENLSYSDYQEMLRSKGEFGRNLLQAAACYSKELKIHLSDEDVLNPAASFTFSLFIAFYLFISICRS